jgi:hypothetical protein
MLVTQAQPFKISNILLCVVMHKYKFSKVDVLLVKGVNAKPNTLGILFGLEATWASNEVPVLPISNKGLQLFKLI